MDCTLLEGSRAPELTAALVLFKARSESPWGIPSRARKTSRVTFWLDRLCDGGTVDAVGTVGGGGTVDGVGAVNAGGTDVAGGAVAPEPRFWRSKFSRKVLWEAGVDLFSDSLRLLIIK